MFLVLGAVLLTPYLDWLLVPFIYRGLARELGEFTRLNPHLAKALAGAVTMAAYAFVWRCSPRLKWLPQGRAGAVTLAFWGSVTALNLLRMAATSEHNFDKNGETLRWYNIRQDGSVVYFYEGGIDRKTGEDLKPVIPEIWSSLEAFRRGSLHLADPEATAWFHRNGMPNLYYWRKPGGEDIEFWNGPGIHPFERQELKPVDGEVRQAYLLLKEKQQKAEQATRAGMAAAEGREALASLTRSSSEPITVKPAPAAPGKSASASETAPTSVVTAMFQAPVTFTPPFLSVAAIGNHTRDTLTIEVETPGGWQTSVLRPGMVRHIRVPLHDVGIRWQDRHAIRVRTLRCNRVDAPFPSDMRALEGAEIRYELFVAPDGEIDVRRFNRGFTR